MRLVFISSVMATSALRTTAVVIGSTVAVGSSGDGLLILSSRRAETIISKRLASTEGAPQQRAAARAPQRGPGAVLPLHLPGASSALPEAIRAAVPASGRTASRQEARRRASWGNPR